MNKLPIPLFHGTSTLFLDSIMEAGLGGRNPVLEWRILEFAQVVYPLVEQNLGHEDEFMVKVQSFGFMTEQKSAAMNFQHGDTYLSPAASTAVRYAVNKRFSSELLSYTLEFLEELLHRKVPGVADDLYRRYPRIFNLLSISSAPLLIEVLSVEVSDLATENGADAAATLEHINKTLREDASYADVLLQQSNFRLRRAVPASELKISLINVTSWDPFKPEYTLYEIPPRPGRHVGA